MQTEVQTNSQNTNHEAKHEAKAVRVAGVYVIIGRNAEGELLYGEKHSRKEFRDATNALLDSGGTLVKAYRGAREMRATVKQVVSF